MAASAGPSNVKNINGLPRDLGRKPCGRKSQTMINEATPLIASTGPMRFRSSSTSAPQRSADAALEYVNDGRRVDADADDHGNQAGHGNLLVPLSRVGEVVPACVGWAEEHALHRPQDVAGRQQDAEHGKPRSDLEARCGADE